jgi:threonylcarbamoyladenosine tRNA methylthiotransferase MtaB
MCTRTVCTTTFGCKVNQYEGQAIQEELVRHGLTPWDEFQDGADAYIVNTCTVTDSAFKDGLRFVRKVSRNNPQSLIVVTGCAANSNPEEFRRINGVTVFGNEDKPGIASYIAGKLDTRPQNIFQLGITRFPQHTRAFLKVQDGCDLNCSFCIIPQVRGASRSRPFQDALDEAHRLVEAGYKEIVLTGVHLGSFGKERSKHGELPRLMKEMLAIPGLARIRLSSIEINEVTDELIQLIKSEPWRICPHLHVPAQSGTDKVLRDMRRRYSTRQFYDTVGRLASVLPDPSFTTDVIVGFPTETEDDFDATLEFCRRVGFSRIHIFPYSPRHGTDAAALCDLPWPVKKARMERLERLAFEMGQAYAEKFVGRQAEVVIEEVNGVARGYTERYIRAQLPAEGLRQGNVVRMTGVEAHGATLMGSLIK